MVAMASLQALPRKVAMATTFQSSAPRTADEDLRPVLAIGPPRSLKNKAPVYSTESLRLQSNVRAGTVITSDSWSVICSDIADLKYISRYGFIFVRQGWGS